jgi:hypothetical protein
MGAIGYVFAGIGLAIIVLSNQIFTYLSKLFTIKLPFVIIAGVAFVLLGVILLMGNSPSGQTVKHAAEEVPIYEGEGKNKRIIGYKKAPTK